jgi:hypothetical protein
MKHNHLNFLYTALYTHSSSSSTIIIPSTIFTSILLTLVWNILVIVNVLRIIKGIKNVNYATLVLIYLIFVQYF